MDTEITFDETNYYNFFGLNSNPFPIAPDSEFFYVSEPIEQIITELVHGIITRKGFLILTGEVGLGKTTISRRMMFLLDRHKVKTSLVLHTSIQSTELLREINRDFGLQEESLLLSDQMTALNNFLLEQNNQGTNCVIIIDDAQNLDFKSFELVRMISNLEADRKKLVQVLLIGQPELYEKLSTKELRQLKSRISIQKEAVPLIREEVHDYIYFKLNSSGNAGATSIEQDAIDTIHKFTGGNFREINVLMDRSLYVAFLCDTTKIDRKIITDAYFDIHRKKAFFDRFRLHLILGVILAALIIWSFFSFIKIDFIKKSIPDKFPILKTEEKTPGVPPPIEKRKNEKNQTIGQENPPRNQILFIPEISKPVLDFLAHYNLNEYTHPFDKAIKAGDFKEIKKRIYNETGLKLIQLNNFNEKIRKDFGVLSYDSKTGTDNSYLLFWSPPIIIKHFYYSYYGEEIYILQDLLAHHNMYAGKRDGVIGKGVMTGINKFQKKMDIPISGFPDDNTLFLLYNN